MLRVSRHTQPLLPFFCLLQATNAVFPSTEKSGPSPWLPLPTRHCSQHSLCFLPVSLALSKCCSALLNGFTCTVHPGTPAEGGWAHSKQVLFPSSVPRVMPHTLSSALFAEPVYSLVQRGVRFLRRAWGLQGRHCTLPMSPPTETGTIRVRQKNTCAWLAWVSSRSAMWCWVFDSLLKDCWAVTLKYNSSCNSCVPKNGWDRVNGWKSCLFSSKQHMLRSTELESKTVLYEVLDKEVFYECCCLKSGLTSFKVVWSCVCWLVWGPSASPINGCFLLPFHHKKGAHAFENISDANETNQRAWSFEETLPYWYKITINEVGLIVQVPANLLVHSGNVWCHTQRKHTVTQS